MKLVVFVVAKLLALSAEELERLEAARTMPNGVSSKSEVVRQAIWEFIERRKDHGSPVVS